VILSDVMVLDQTQESQLTKGLFTPVHFMCFLRSDRYLIFQNDSVFAKLILICYSIPTLYADLM